MAKMRGYDIKTDWRRNEQGEITMHIRIKRWYFPILAFKHLRKSGIPRRYWPLFYWQYYVQRRWKRGVI